MEFLKVISQDWVGSLIGLVGLIGLIISFFVFRASRTGPRPVCQYQALRLIGREEHTLPEEVTILFKDKKVQRLTKTHIVLWNSGNSILNGENIVTDDPLRLEFSENSEVLSVEVVKFTRKPNNVTANINPDSRNEVVFSFNYLNPKDGAVLELYHTAEENFPEIKGSIRGIPKGILSWGRILPPPGRRFPFRHWTTRLFFFYGLFTGVFITAYGFFRPIYPEFFTKKIEPTWTSWIFVAVGLIIILSYSLLLWRIRKRFPKPLFIHDFE